MYYLLTRIRKLIRSFSDGDYVGIFDNVILTFNVKAFTKVVAIPCPLVWLCVLGWFLSHFRKCHQAKLQNLWKQNVATLTTIICSFESNKRMFSRCLSWERQAGVVDINHTFHLTTNVVCGLSFSRSQLDFEGFLLVRYGYHHRENTGSRLFTEVKPCWTGLISGWVTI